MFNDYFVLLPNTGLKKGKYLKRQKWQETTHVNTQCPTNTTPPEQKNNRMDKVKTKKEQ